MREIIIDLPSDYQGKVCATIISSPSDKASQRAVLYLHGYIDYFFQDHMAEAFNRAGVNFYAIDLRGYGRSIQPGQRPYYCRSTDEYFPEIDAALELMQSEGNSDITLLGHSTGGLIASIYCASGRQRAAVTRLILNSPFFEFNTSWFKRRIAIPLSGIISLMLPYAHKRNELSPHYFTSVHRSERGEWDFDARLKPKDGVPLYFAWLRAIQHAQQRVHRGLGLQLPVLVLHSAHSWWGKSWDEGASSADAVLNVEHISHYARTLGSNVRVESIEGGLHDLILSRLEIREHVLARMIRFVEQTT